MKITAEQNGDAGGRGADRPDAVGNNGNFAHKSAARRNPRRELFGANAEPPDVLLFEDHILGSVMRTAGSELGAELPDRASIEPAVAMGADRPAVGLPLLDQRPRSQ